jgi:hypothetical protein
MISMSHGFRYLKSRFHGFRLYETEHLPKHDECIVIQLIKAPHRGAFIN